MSKDSMSLIKSLIKGMKKTTKQKTGLTGLGKFQTWRSPMSSKKKK
jgi:hypothetical protein